MELRFQCYAVRWSAGNNDECVTSVVRQGTWLGRFFSRITRTSPDAPPRRQSSQTTLPMAHSFACGNGRARGVYSRVVLVPKRSGRWRMVIDLHSLIQFTLVDSFKMGSVDSIRQALRVG